MRSSESAVSRGSSYNSPMAPHYVAVSSLSVMERQRLFLGQGIPAQFWMKRILLRGQGAFLARGVFTKRSLLNMCIYALFGTDLFTVQPVAMPAT